MFLDPIDWIIIISILTITLIIGFLFTKKSSQITTVIWISVTFTTAPENKNTLLSFYKKTNPGGPGWKKIIKNQKNRKRDMDSSCRNISNNYIINNDILLFIRNRIFYLWEYSIRNHFIFNFCHISNSFDVILE